MGLIRRYPWGPPLALFLAMGLLGLVWPYEPGQDVDLSQAYASPSAEFWLGTDRLGRDLFHRLVAATRGFFLPGLLAALLAAVLGVGLGAFSGYAPGPMALGAPRRGQALLLKMLRGAVRLALALPGTLPRFVSMVLACAAFGFEPFLLAAVAGVLYAAELGEEVRATVRARCTEEYIESARAEGLSLARVLGRHILYLQCRALVMRHLVFLWAFFILVETSLSYLPGEFGIQEPTPSWGNMLIGAKDGVLAGHYWPAVLPTLAITSTVILLAYLGDRLSSHQA